MHELSIANQLVELAEDAARAEGASRVTAVHLELGVLSGVVRESLEFAWELARRDTLLSGAELRIEPKGALVRCSACGNEGAPIAPDRLRCAACGEPTPDVRGGRELVLRSIELETDGETPQNTGGQR